MDSFTGSVAYGFLGGMLFDDFVLAVIFTCTAVFVWTIYCDMKEPDHG